MVETLVDIDNPNFILTPVEARIEIDDSNIPATQAQDAGRLSKIKKWLIGYIYLPEQQHASFNSTPYFMTLITIIRLLFLLGAFISIYFKNHQTSLDFILPFSLYTISCLIAHIFIGIPLEIAFGTLRTSAFYILSIMYPHLVGEVILTEYDFLSMDPCALALFGLHLSNIIRNWKFFPSKYMRIIVLLTLGFSLELYIFRTHFGANYWRIILFRLTCGIAGFLYGVLTGFFWVYRNKEEDKPETSWRSFSIILTCLVAYLIIAELSGLHLTFEEYLIKYYQIDKDDGSFST